MPAAPDRRWRLLARPVLRPIVLGPIVLGPIVPRPIVGGTGGRLALRPTLGGLDSRLGGGLDVRPVVGGGRDGRGARPSVGRRRDRVAIIRGHLSEITGAARVECLRAARVRRALAPGDARLGSMTCDAIKADG